MPKLISAPASEEYASFYRDYIQRASQREDVYAALSRQIDEFHAALDTLTDSQACFKPGPKEWSIKEVIGHINDIERVFSYRLIRISRNDTTPLPGIEQDDYVREAGFDNCLLQDLLQEFEYLRRANILSIRNMSETSTLRGGTASGYPVSARALIYMLVGHADHHMASLQEKYLPQT